MLRPRFSEILETRAVPDWIGLGLARALLFYAQRLDYWSGGTDPEWPLRELVAHIHDISGGTVDDRGPHRDTPS